VSSDDAAGETSSRLKGTTYRVYRYLFKQRKPAGISEVQHALGLSSPSVAQYHIKKLLQMGLIREEHEGYTAEKAVFENLVRIRRVSVPLQSAYVAFFAVTLTIMLVFLRPQSITSFYFLALAVNLVALGVSSYEVFKSSRGY
jgi:DNA-binding transcriptional ArsR family regulator